MHDLRWCYLGDSTTTRISARRFNPEYALIWRPTSALTLRTSLAQSFRPPPLFDLHIPRVDVSMTDRGSGADNGEFALPIWRAGGNPDLRPSSADSLRLGLRIRAEMVAELCVSEQTTGASPLTMRSQFRLPARSAGGRKSAFLKESFVPSHRLLGYCGRQTWPAAVDRYHAHELWNRSHERRGRQRLS